MMKIMLHLCESKGYALMSYSQVKLVVYTWERMRSFADPVYKWLF